MKRTILFTAAVFIFLNISSQGTAQTEAVNTKHVKIESDKKHQAEQKKEEQKKAKPVKQNPGSGTLQTNKKNNTHPKSGGSKISTGPAGTSHGHKTQQEKKSPKGTPSKGNPDHSVKVQADGKTVKMEQKKETQTPAQKPVVLSTQARKVEQTQKTVKSTKGKIQQAQAKIDYLRKQIQEAYDAKKITEAEYKEKMSRLDEYEKKMLELKKENKALTTEMKDELTKKQNELEEAHKKGEISDEVYQQRKAELEKLESNYYNSLYNKNKLKNPNQAPPSGKVTKQGK